VTRRGDGLRGRVSRLFRPEPRSEVADELAFHLEQRVREYLARGMVPAAARAAALERFGNVEGVREECAQLLAEDRRAEARRDWMDDLRQDLRFGVRAAVRAPMFSLLAIATLALGIGANAAVFGVVKSVLLDPLPYADGGRLVRVYSRFEASEMERSSTSPGAASDIAARVRAFQNVAPFNFSTAAQQAAIKASRRREIVDRKGQVERRQRHCFATARPANHCRGFR